VQRHRRGSQREDTKIEGDPTEAALTVAAEKAGVLADLGGWQRIAEIPFESQNQYMATLHDGPAGRLLLVKGASDVLLDRCSDALDETGLSRSVRPRGGSPSGR
jgi:magnesium-transporting ATPase (P-type)